MGAKLAAPDGPVIEAAGDGSTMFANPVAYHQIAEAQNLSIVVIVMTFFLVKRAAEWAAVRHSVKALYTNGFSACSNETSLTSLAPDFVKVAEALAHMGEGAGAGGGDGGGRSVGPNAVRNICRRRPLASSAAPSSVDGR